MTVADSRPAPVLTQVGLDGQTWDYVLSEAEHSHSPDYIMSVLADSYEHESTADSALIWRQQAWKAAGGSATRFGRGTRYVRSLLSLTPHNSRLIERITIKVSRELSIEPDAFFQRVTRAMEHLETALHEWTAAHTARGNRRLRHPLRILGRRYRNRHDLRTGQLLP